MMCDAGDRVYVRLWDPGGTPHYVEVDKELIAVRGPAGFQAITARQAVECVCRWVRQQQIFTGKRGTGFYTAAQVRLYDEIAQHLQARRPVRPGHQPLVGTWTRIAGPPASRCLRGWPAGTATP